MLLKRVFPQVLRRLRPRFNHTTPQKGIILIFLKSEVMFIQISVPSYFVLKDPALNENASALVNSMTVYDDFLSLEEENSLMEELEPYMRRLKYEFDHWDDVMGEFY